MNGFEVLGDSGREVKAREQRMNRELFGRVAKVYEDRVAAIEAANQAADEQLETLVSEFLQSESIEDTARKFIIRITAEQLFRIMPEIMQSRRLQNGKHFSHLSPISYSDMEGDIQVDTTAFFNAMCIAARSTGETYKLNVLGYFDFQVTPETEVGEIQEAFEAAGQRNADEISRRDSRGIDEHLS
ncbi:hypothetical protein KW794_00800 [Candidatus Saccharibacteria bacterium]|nr:hypothetical protein [Candidatus Saccharibacteria bacterium]